MWSEGHTRHARVTSAVRLSRSGLGLLAVALAALWLAAPALADDLLPPAPVPAAKSAIIIDGVTGRVLYGKNIHVERPMASTTKIMTALLAIQRSRNLGHWLTAPGVVANESGIGLVPGQRITVRQALLGLMLKSAQDCAVTLACGVARNETAFVRLMNARARKLGLRDTHYTDSRGNRPDRRHHSSVADLARLGRIAMRNAVFRDIARRQRATIRWDGDRSLKVASNNLLLRWDWADGVKCGFTGTARFCLVGSGQPGLRPFITATLASPRRDREARDHAALFEWASGLYEEKTVVAAGDVLAEVPLDGGGQVLVAARTTLTSVVRSAAPVRPTFTLPDGFSQRPGDGAVVGRVVYRADGVKLGTVRLVVAPEAPASSPSPEASAPAPDAPAQGTGL